MRSQIKSLIFSLYSAEFEWEVCGAYKARSELKKLLLKLGFQKLNKILNSQVRFFAYIIISRSTKMLVQIADLRLCARMSLRYNVPEPLCLRPYVPVPLIPYVGFRRMNQTLRLSNPVVLKQGSISRDQRFSGDWEKDIHYPRYVYSIHSPLLNTKTTKRVNWCTLLMCNRCIVHFRPGLAPKCAARTRFCSPRLISRFTLNFFRYLQVFYKKIFMSNFSTLIFQTLISNNSL